MDIGSVGSLHFQQANNPFASPSVPGSINNRTQGSFEDILKRAQSSQSSPAERKDSSPTLGAKKIIIDKNDKLYEACMELETFLIKSLIKGMRGTVQKSKLIDTGFAGEMYEDMLYDEYAKTYSKNANFGFDEMAYQELTGQR